VWSRDRRDRRELVALAPHRFTTLLVLKKREWTNCMPKAKMAR
jgi:hypothetical protein